MGWIRFLRRRWWDKERASEIASYLEIETAENIARGMTPADAAAEARRKFGNPVLVREEIYRMNSIGWLESIWQDLRYGARLLRLSPGFTLVAILSLALGIGANTAIFQLLNAVRLRSLPIQNPQELAEVRIVGGNRGMGLNPARYGGLTRPIWEQIRRQQEAFTGAFAWSLNDVRIGESGELRRANAIWVSGEFFPVLGIQPWRGRLFLPEDEAAACPASRVVVSHAFWLAQMGGRELARDNKLMINLELHEVIGVTPPGFTGLAVGESFDVALPFCQPREPHRRDIFNTTIMGRLRPGWTLERASAHFDAVSRGIFEETALTGYGTKTIGNYKKFRLAAYSASSGISSLRDSYDTSLLLLLAITGLVLLIACANLVNLMLARASAREREIAVRLALGASSGRLFRQLLLESALLAGMGAALGIGLAQLMSRALVSALSPDKNSIHLSMEIDWRVFLFVTAVATLTCVVFGVIPSLRVTRIQPESVMRAGGRGLTTGRERFSMQRFMVVTQIAVSLVLLFGALLFVRSFRNLMTFDPGMRQENIVVAFTGFERARVLPERYEAFQRDLLEDVRAVPGVINAASTTMVPLLGGAWSHGVHVGGTSGSSMFTWVSPGYFETMRIPLLTGRDFNQSDTGASKRVAVVNQAFVRQFIGEVNPIGQTLRTSPEPGFPSTVYEIVGVIADTRNDNLRSKIHPTVFAPASQWPLKAPWGAMMIHSNLAPATVMSSVKKTLTQKHPAMVIEFADFRTRIQNGLVRERLMAILSGFFGLLAVVLAMVGLYGVISYLVARRRNEIGIRVALGADRGRVIGLILGEGTKLLIIGLAIGAALSLIAGRSAGALLFGLKPHDPVTLVAAGALLALVAIAASLVPANRAAKLDPMTALRHE